MGEKKIKFIVPPALMGRKKRHHYEAAARARHSRHLTTVTIEYDAEDPQYEEERHWTGGVNHYVSDAESRWETESSDSEPDSDLDTELRFWQRWSFGLGLRSGAGAGAARFG